MCDVRNVIGVFKIMDIVTGASTWNAMSVSMQHTFRKIVKGVSNFHFYNDILVYVALRTSI